MKLFNKSKKGMWWMFIQLLFSPVGLAVLAIISVVLIGLLVAGFFALKSLIIWAIILAFIAAGLYIAIFNSNIPAGIVVALLGVGLLFATSQGLIQLSFFGNEGRIVSIDVDNNNVLKYAVFQTKALKGANGVIALFDVDNDDFIRADYFHIKTNGNRPEGSSFRKGFQKNISLDEYFTPGDHTIRVYKENPAHSYDQTKYKIDEYWNMEQCNYDWKNKGYDYIEVDKDTRKFNYKWLPCSQTKSGTINPIIPANVLYKDNPYFYYENLSESEIDKFKDLPYVQFTFTIPEESRVDTTIPDNESVDDVDKPVDENLWQKFVSWIKSIKITA